MKPIKHFSVLALTTIVLALQTGVYAKDAQPAATKTPAAPTAPAVAKASKPLPYAGVVSAVDPAKKTFTFKDKDGERTFAVVATTKFENKASKKPATFEDIAVNSYLTGSYLKKGDTLEAYSVHLGKPAPGAPAKPKTAAPTTTPAKKP